MRLKRLAKIIIAVLHLLELGSVGGEARKYGNFHRNLNPWDTRLEKEKEIGNDTDIFHVPLEVSLDVLGKLANKDQNDRGKSIRFDYYRFNGVLPYEMTSFLMKCQNVWEFSGQFEGDIVFTKPRAKDAIMLYRELYWPNGVLPYELSSDLNRKEKKTILKSLQFIANKTCIKPVPANEDHEGSILFSSQSGYGCSSILGYWQNKSQMVYLDRHRGCIKFGVVLHELLHVLGFWHQHSAHNRDDYIEIQWANVQLGAEVNFEKAFYRSTSFGFPYDYESVMHYGAYAFSRNGHKTILLTHNLKEGVELGQKETLSKLDIGKLNKMYNCN